MCDMKRIWGLLVCFKRRLLPKDLKSATTSDMLKRKHFDKLMKSVEEYTVSEKNQIKAGLKSALFYIIGKFASIIKACFLMKDDDGEANEIDKFVNVLILNKHIMFGNGTYILNRNRQETLRRPDKLATYIINSAVTVLNSTSFLY